MKLGQFTTAQKRGVLILLVGLILILGWRWRVASLAAEKTTDIVETTVDSTRQPSKPAVQPQVYVDLNTADTATLRTVKGIGPAYARRIVRFREIYGGFVDPQQLIDVLGLQPNAYLRIEPQVHADTTTSAYTQLRGAAAAKTKALQALTHTPKPYPGNGKAKSDYASRNKASTNSQPVPTSKPAYSSKPAWQKRPAPQLVDLNQADSAALDAIPGIGPRTAQEIIKLRQSIYFIHTLDQVADLWCINEENFAKMSPYLRLSSDHSSYPHIPINTGTVDDLAAHRYIRYKEARKIINYRTQHGPFASSEDLHKMLGIPADFWEKVEPYIEY